MQLFTLATLALGAAGVQASASTFSQQLCSTKHGSSSLARVPTSTIVASLTFTVRATSTSTPVKTVTPTPVTSSITQSTTTTLTTTASLMTDTATTTSTVTSSSTAFTTTTFTTVSTVSTTVTSTPATSTIPTPAGFTPVASNPANAGANTESGMKRQAYRRHNNPRGDGLEEMKDVVPRSARKFTSGLALSGGRPVCVPDQYPSQVICEEAVEVFTTRTITKTASTTATTTATPSTITSTSTSTISTTSTVFPDDVTSTVTAFTTLVPTTTSTVSTISTSTVTNTVTVSAPTPTFYAACASNNIIGGINGAGIVSDYGSSGYTQVQTDGTAYGCCAACMGTPGCFSSALSNSICYIAEPGTTCSPATVQQHFQISGSPNTAFQFYILSNGPCGQLQVAP